MCHSSNFCGISFMLIYIYIYRHCCLILLLDMFIKTYSGSKGLGDHLQITYQKKDEIFFSQIFICILGLF